MSKEYELIIIGAGSAGMAAAQYGARANLKTLVLEEMAAGGQALLIADLENYPGFPDAVDGYEFSEKLKNQTLKFGAEMKTESVKEIRKEGNTYTVKTPKEEYTTQAIILATGAKHKHLDIPGEEELYGRGVSYCATCDGPFFKGKKILVVGGGDAACDEAQYLANLSDKIIMIHRRDRFRAQPVLAERVMNNPNIEVRFNTICTKILGDDKVSSVELQKTDSDETYTEELDAVFIFIGSIPQTQLVEHFDVEKDEAGYIITTQEMASNVPGLYAIGDVRNTAFRQIITACGDGATAAHCASQYLDELKGQAYGD